MQKKKQGERKKSKKFEIIMFIIDILITVAVIFTVYHFVMKAYNYTFEKGKYAIVNSNNENNKVSAEIVIKKETTVQEVALILKEKKIISNTTFFVFENKIFGNTKSVKPGTYEVDSSMSNVNLLDALYGEKDATEKKAVTPDNFATDAPK